MGKRIKALNWSKFADEVCEGKRWVVYDDMLKAAAEDERDLRDQLAKCRESNAKLAEEVKRLHEELELRGRHG